MTAATKGRVAAAIDRLAAAAGPTLFIFAAVVVATGRAGDPWSRAATVLLIWVGMAAVRPGRGR